MPQFQTEGISMWLNANATPSPLGADALSAGMDKVMSLYPDDPSAGSPFGTGNQTFGTGTGYKWGAAIRTSSLSSTLLSHFCIDGLLSASWGRTLPSPTAVLDPNTFCTVLRLPLHRSPAER